MTSFRTLIKSPRETRFHKLSDFYSMVVLLQQFRREKLVLYDAQRNAKARKMLVGFSTGVEKLNVMSKHLEFAELQPDQQISRSYLQTVKEGTDSIGNRKQRNSILYSLVAPIFETRDEKRLFSEAQRRILWNSADQKICAFCREKLDWSDLTIDHVVPHALGGKTVLGNGQLSCRPCNSKQRMKRTKAA